MKFRMRYAVAGGHTHIRVFAGRTEGSLGKCGDLVFRNDEWDELVPPLARAGIEILAEGEPPKVQP